MRFWELAPPGYKLRLDIEKKRRKLIPPWLQEEPDFVAEEQAGLTALGERQFQLEGIAAFRQGQGPPGVPKPSTTPSPQVPTYPTRTKPSATTRIAESFAKEREAVSGAIQGIPEALKGFGAASLESIKERGRQAQTFAELLNPFLTQAPGTQTPEQQAAFGEFLVTRTKEELGALRKLIPIPESEEQRQEWEQNPINALLMASGPMGAFRGLFEGVPGAIAAARVGAAQTRAGAGAAARGVGKAAKQIAEISAADQRGGIKLPGGAGKGAGKVPKQVAAPQPGQAPLAQAAPPVREGVDEAVESAIREAPVPEPVPPTKVAQVIPPEIGVTQRDIQELQKIAQEANQPIETPTVYGGTLYRGIRDEETHLSDGGFFGIGEYYSTSPEIAEIYGKKIITSPSDLKNPLFLDASYEKRNVVVDAFWEKYGNVVDVKELKEQQQIAYNITKKLKAEGYDGVVVKYDGLHTEVVKFPDKMPSLMDFNMKHVEAPAPELVPPTKVAQGEAAITPSPVKPTAAAAPQPGAGVTPPVKPPRVGKQQIYGKGTPPPTETRIQQPRTFDEGVPPPDIPTTTGSGVTPGTTPPGIADDLAQTDAIVKRDKPGATTRLIDSIPGLKQVQRYMGKKNLQVKNNILSGWIALGHTHSKVYTTLRAELTPVLNTLEQSFGKGSLDGSGQVARFIGPDDQVVPFSGTLYDVMQRPQFYDLTDTQRQLLRDIKGFEDGLFNRYKGLYDFDMGQFDIGPDAVFLRNVDRSEAGTAVIKSEQAALMQGATKERFYQTGADRWLHDKKLLDEGRITANKVFKPDVNVANLMNANDNIIASLSSHKVFETALQGKTKLQIYQELHPGVKPTAEQLDIFNPRGYSLVQEGGLNKYFEANDAIEIRRMLKRSESPILRFIDDLRATAFGGDLSPATIQGLNSWLMDPVGVGKTIGREASKTASSHKFFNAWQQANLEKWVRENPETSQMFTMSTGLDILRGFQKEEFGAGFIGKIPKVGRYWRDFNDAIYRPLISNMKDSWESIYKAGLESGLSKWDAAAYAADDVTKQIPNYSWRRLGMSEAEAAHRRALMTSVSFLTQPVSMMNDAVKGIVKLGTLGHVKPTPTEVFAMKRVLTLAAMSMSISATTAAVYNKKKGRSDEAIIKAVQDAIKPGNWAVTFPDGSRGSISGPYNSILRAVAPGDVAGLPVKVPFAGIGRFVTNKAHPVIGIGVEEVRNKDYFDRQIRTGDFPLNVLQSLQHIGEGSVPLTAGAVAEGFRTGMSKGETARQSAGQFAGMNIYKPKEEQLLQIAEEKYPELLEGVTPGEPLPPGVKGALELSPEGRAIKEQAGRATPEDKIKWEDYDKRVKRDNEYRQARMSPTDWRDTFHNDNLVRMAQSEFKERLGMIRKKDRKNMSDTEKVLDDYYTMMENLSDPVRTGRLKQEARFEIELWEAKLTDKQRQDLRQNLHPRATDMEKEYYADMDNLKPYFDVTNKSPLITDKGKTKAMNDIAVLENRARQLQVAGDWQGAQMAAYEAQKLDAIYQITGWRKYLAAQRKMLRGQNPEIDRLLVKWGYASKPLQPLPAPTPKRELAGVR